MAQRIHGIPFANSTVKPQYDYTPEMYAEDKRIAHWFVFIKCKNVRFEKSITKEDIEQWCLARLWQSRPRYDQSKGKYFTWAWNVCQSTVFYSPLLRQNQLDNERDDLDRVIAINEHGEKYCVIDTVSQDNGEISTDELIRVAYIAVDKIKQPTPRKRAKQVIDLLLSGKARNSKHAAEILGISRERVRQLLSMIRKNALQIYRHDDIAILLANKPNLTKPTTQPQKQKRKPRKPFEIDLQHATLKQLYQSKGMTQRELAKMLGVDASSVGYWSRGCWKPRPQTIEKIAKIFSCTFDEILEILQRRECEI